MTFRPQRPAGLLTVLVPLLLLAAGLPALAHAAMPECPEVVPAADCHHPAGPASSTDELVAATSGDCCSFESLPPAVTESQAPTVAFDVAAAAIPVLAAPRPTARPLDLAPPLAAGPSGRDLLSLHQTFLN